MGFFAVAATTPSELRLFVAGIGLTAMALGYYENWRERRRGEAVLMWVLALSLFWWAAFGNGYLSLVWVFLGWIVVLLVGRFVGRRLPRLVITRSGSGFTVQRVAPENVGSRRLKRETLAVVADMYKWLKAHPDNVLADSQADWAEMATAKSDEERSAIWQRQHAERDTAERAATQELNEIAGGRTAFVLKEFERRGRVKMAEREHMLWKLNSAHWIKELVRDLEALAHGL